MNRPIFTPSVSPLELPDLLMRSEAAQAHELASEVFEPVFGPSGTLEQDLETAGRFFDPVAQGQRLRREIEAMPPSNSRADELPASWTMLLPDGKVLLTPEGIAGMHALRRALGTNPERAVELREHVRIAGDALLNRYRIWSSHRIRGVVALLEGSDKPLQFQGAGLLLTLLVNGNVGEDRALTRADSKAADKRDAIDRAFDSAVTAFTHSLSPNSKRKSGGERLISGWKLGEVARRLGGGLVISPPTGDQAGSVFVRANKREAAISLVARDLARGNRQIPSADALGEAYDHLVAAFLGERVTLASYGELRESARDTERLRDDLLSAFAEQVD